MGAESKDRREATVILGRAAVDAALADPSAAERVIAERTREVRAAVDAILALLPDRVAEAAAFAAGLEPELRVAIAAAWVDDAARRVLAAGGIVEGPP